MAVIARNSGSTHETTGGRQYVWGAMATGDTSEPIQGVGDGPLAGGLQGTGTFGGATLTLEKSMNGSDWVPVIDSELGSAIALTAVTEGAEFSTAFPWLRAKVTGGAAVAIVPILHLVG